MMKKTGRKWMAAAIALAAAGIVLCGAAAISVNFDWMKLSGAKYITNSHAPEESFDRISIETTTADVEFLPSGDGACRLVFYEEEAMQHSFEVENGELRIRPVDNRKWYDHLRIGFGAPKLSLYLPDAEYSALTIDSDTGSVDLPGDFRFGSMHITGDTGKIDCRASADTMEIHSRTGQVRAAGIAGGDMALSTTTGDIVLDGIGLAGQLSARSDTGRLALSNIRCESLALKSDTGDMALSKLVAEGAISIESGTGDVRFDGCDAGELIVGTDTGDVTGSLLTEKIFFCRSDTGRVRVPEGMSGGKCSIETDTGDIQIDISGQDAA